MPASNLDTGALRAVGEGDAMTWVGAYDLIGNVREWLANARGDQRLILGGSANDAYYIALNSSVAAPAIDRSAMNGFRTVKTQDEAIVAERAQAPLPELAAPAGIRAEPVSDEVYAAYERVFAYEPKRLNAEIEGSQTSRNWVRERITFNAAYGDERMLLYLYLPNARSRTRGAISRS